MRVSTWTWRSTSAAIGLVGEPGADQRGVGAALGQPGAPVGMPGPGCLPVERASARGAGTAAGRRGRSGRGGWPPAPRCARRRPAELDADPLGRVEPAQRGQPPVGAVRCPQPQFPQGELEQRRRRSPASGRTPRARRDGAGACVQLKAGWAATRPHTASRGARPGSARAARRISSTAQTPAAPSSAKNSRYGHGPRRPMLRGRTPPGPARRSRPHDANPPSSTYWAADAAVSRARECWPVTRQPLRSTHARDGGGRAAQIRREGVRRPGPRCRACPLAACRSRGCCLPSPSTTFKLTGSITEINSG